jgi:hypothetical protein
MDGRIDDRGLNRLKDRVRARAQRETGDRMIGGETFQVVGFIHSVLNSFLHSAIDSALA